MTRPAAMGFTYHALDYSKPAPDGYFVCTRCDNFINQEKFLDESCPSTFGKGEEPGKTMPVERQSYSQLPGGLRCVFCGAPVLVEPRHRDYVGFFGACCDACFDLVPVQA